MQTRDFAPTSLKWWRPPVVAPDLNGPMTVPFEPLDQAVLDRPIFSLLSAIAERQPQAAALRDADRSIDYATLRHEVERLARRITAAVPYGRAVGVIVADGIELALAMLACLAAGRVCLLISIEYPAERIIGILKGAAAGGVVVQTGSARMLLPDGISTIVMEETAGTDADAALDAADADEPALVIYTSGSGGEPKGIVRSQRQVLYLGWQQVRRFHMNPTDRVLSPYTLTTGGGLVSFMMTLLGGACFYPMNVPAVGARAVLERARQERITLITGTPSLLRVLFALNGDGDAFASLRALYTTGESLLAADIAAWRRVLRDDCAISYSYGMGEGGALAGWFPPRDWDGEAARLPIGYPNADYEYAVENRRRQPGEAEAGGVLWARSPLLSLGEWRDGRCVPGRLMGIPDDPAMVVLSTGDVVRLRSDGLIEFLGRTDAQVKIRGNRVEPAELENLLLRSPGVAEAAVLTRGTGPDIALVAFVVPSQRGTASLHDALMKRVREALPVYMHPARLRLVEELPRMPTGKVDLRALAMADDVEAPVEPPSRWRRWFGAR